MELERSSPPLPGVRAFRTTLRTLHLLAFGVLYGGHVYGVDPDRLVPALVATVGSGVVFAAFEIYRERIWPVQVRGLATFAKLVLVAGVAPFWELRIPLLTLAAVVGAVVSHMPGRYRYYSVWHGQVIGSQEKG